MIKRHVPILMSGLALGLVLMVFRSLALAQGPVSQEDAYVHISSPVVQVGRQEPIELSAEQVASHAVSIEPVQLQIAERITVESRLPLAKSLLPKVRLAERDHAIQPIRREYKALIGQGIGEAYPITQSVPTHDSGYGDVRPAAVCVVNSTDDSGPGTLRQCLENAVAGDTITFDPGVFPPASPATILLSSELPWITTDNLTIDASDAGVILDGSGLSSGYGLVVWGAEGVKIRGLQIVHFPADGIAIAGGTTNTVIGGNRFTGSGPLGQGNLISGNGDDGIQFQDEGTSDNQILGNFIGTDVSGTTALANLEDGVFIFSEASNNIIGGDTPGTGNLISGNNGDAGVKIMGNGTMDNVVLGNYIGTNISGTAPLANVEHGVVIYDGATNNVIGGTTDGAHNLISGNGEIGIVIAYAGTSGNQVLGNYIGTDVSGTIPIPNYRGVLIYEGPTDNTIGGDSPDAGNFINGNTKSGVWIEGSDTMNNQVTRNIISSNGEDGIVIHNAAGNQVLGNYIGTDPTGTTPLGNLRAGVLLDGASNNFIGGATSGAGNLISDNEFSGIHLQGSGTTDNQIQGNFIGTDVSGTVALGNLDRGIVVSSKASDNIIGGDRFTGSGPLGQGNLISGNKKEGIWLSGVDVTGNQVLGNLIGIDISGTAALGNLKGGIFIGNGASNNIAGGNTSGVRNIISGNIFDGVRLQDPGTTDNQIQGNFIGTDVSGTEALGNLQVGVALLDGVSNNLIGGATSGEGNLISSNGLSGIYLWGPDTTDNQIQGNFIGTDTSGTEALGNLDDGIILLDGSSDNIIGGDRFTGSGPLGQGNLISGNGNCGIVLEGADTMGNQAQGNLVGTNISGRAVLGNLAHGIAIIEGASNNVIGGDTYGVLNLVSGNEDGGVWLQNPGTTGNQIQGNFVGTDISGTKALGNRLGGVILIREASNNLIGGDRSVGDGPLGQGNLISGNEYPGITLMEAGTSNNQVQGNFIGTDVSGTAELGNVLNGIAIIEGASDNIIGGATITVGNTIAFNSDDGIYVSGDQTLRNTISHNSIHDNGGLGIENTNGGNAELAPPKIMTVTNTNVSGQTGPDYIVEVFSDNDGEGRWFESSVTADGDGHFTVTQAGGFHGPELTATATDTNGNTSEFSTPPMPISPGQEDRIFLPIIIKSSD